jgi:hypothetical protein
MGRRGEGERACPSLTDQPRHEAFGGSGRADLKMTPIRAGRSGDSRTSTGDYKGVRPDVPALSGKFNCATPARRRRARGSIAGEFVQARNGKHRFS